MPSRNTHGLVLLATLASMPASQVCAVGLDCPGIADRVFWSEEVVLGRTIKIEQAPDRPGIDAIVIEFKVDESLKGDLYKANDVIHERIGAEIRMKYMMSPYPRPEEGPAFVFLSKNREGKMSAWCMALADEKTTLPRMKRLIAVTSDPLAHLDSDDKVDQCVILAGLMRKYCQFDEQLRGKEPPAKTDNEEKARITAYLLKRAEEAGSVSTQATNILANLDPTPPEAFDILSKALESNVPEKTIAAAQGFSHLRDPRAIPLLLDRIARYRRDEEAGKPSRETDDEESELCYFGRGRFPWTRADVEGSLLKALMAFDDPRVADFVRKEMKVQPSYAVVEKAAQEGDPGTTELLLKKAWERGEDVTPMLCKMSDPRIVEQARERIYDHPRAPYILACQGDPEAREFMHRLIRQGHMVGAAWAEKTQDQSAKNDLLAGLDLAGSVYPFFRNEAAYALGRLRAFELVEGFLGRPKSIDNLGLQGSFLAGLANMPIHEKSSCPGGEKYKSCFHEKLLDVANQEQWNDEQRSLAEKLFKLYEAPPQFAEHHDLYHGWKPPAGLEDMPDPLDTAASFRFFESSTEKCQKALREAAAEDQVKILQSANNCKATVMDGDLAVYLLRNPDRIVASRAFQAISDGRPALSLGDMERWALGGDGYTTSMALNYIRKHPKPDYAPIVVTVLQRGWHLFDSMLFEAIIETKATGAADVLRSHLDHEHVVLRANAAIALAHVDERFNGDGLAELLEKASSAGEVLRENYRTAALKIVEERH